MSESPEQRDFVDRRVKRALMFRALRKIRRTVDDMERTEARNRTLSIVIAAVGIALFVALLWLYIDRSGSERLDTLVDTAPPSSPVGAAAE